MINETSINQRHKHKKIGLTDEAVINMYSKMLLARKFDERALILQRAGKINFHVSGIGQEVAQVAAVAAMKPGKDYFLPYYRDYGLVLSVGMTVKDLMLSIFAKAEDPNSGGRQMPGHFGYKKHKIVTGSSPVTTQVPHAVGFALASKMKNQGFVSFVSFGDGSSNQGDFHEGCNFAGVHKLPVIFFCQNNKYAISVPLSKQVACESIADRALGYGFPGVKVDGNDPFEVYVTVKEARERAVRGEGPTLIDVDMYRLSPHSTSDDDMAYRTKEEVDEHWAKDALPKLKQYMIESGIWSEEKDQHLVHNIAKEIKEATEYGDKAPFPKPEDTLLHVYAEKEA